MKKAIEQRLASYDITVSSPVVIQEFKRRVITEAIYLINLLNAKGSYERVKRHVTNVLPAQWNRKRQICLGMLDEIFENKGDLELTERAKRYLRTLIKFGVSVLKKKVGHIVSGTGCYLSNYPVKEIKPYKRYDLAKKKCSEVYSLCPVADFLKEKFELCKQLLKSLSNLSNKTKELENTCAFLQELIANPDIVHQKDPCLSVGDLLIALESHSIPDFYTMNYKESKVFCDILGQNLIIRPNNPDSPETIYSKNSKPLNP
ncbi:MAG TPA: hypothetical protein ACFYEK_05315 [Candidatus Wunengus sp. YC60]|uniref:hypothetical protein n=1 Tax=Candidatus Wunengus sp. YC60 TaxID=3367697 RepID=UPI00402752DE